MAQETLILPTIGDGEDKSSPLKNCIRNNYRHVRKWAKKNATDCFRIYDRQIREYPLAIDFYAGKYSVHYFARRDEEGSLPDATKDLVEDALFQLFGARKEEIFFRTHSRYKETRQYEKIGSSKDFFVVNEFGVRFWINLVDYLDTGLFLDHRQSRKWIAERSFGKRVLNLFAYTCSFSVHAALSGAVYTKSVDMSNTYTAWGKENLLLNGLSLQQHEVIRADCLRFLEEEREKYDLIIIDPPTISRSKKMEQFFDIQVDYIDLIKKALRLLTKEGTIFFSTNFRRFSFDTTAFSDCVIEEITKKTLPIDFHDPKVHKSWKISLS